MFALELPVTKKTPKYCTAWLEANPWNDVMLANSRCPCGKYATHTIIGNPIRPRMALNIRIGPRVWYLSPTHAVAYIRIAAKTNGGATRHWEAAMLKPMPSRKIIGRKYAIA